jgi:hypothetical protein
MKSAIFAITILLVTMTSNAGPVPTVSFRGDIAPLFAKECVQCHMKEGPAAGLVLENRFSYSMIVNVPSTQSPLKRVVPGDPDNSYLLLKMQNRHLEVSGSGSKMPIFPGGYGAGVLTAKPDEIELIRTWIVAGALDN